MDVKLMMMMMMMMMNNSVLVTNSNSVTGLTPIPHLIPTTLLCYNTDSIDVKNVFLRFLF